MRKSIIFFSTLLLFINSSENLYAQQVDFRPKFFSLHNAKFSLGIGIDGSYSSWRIKASKPSDMKLIYKDPSKDSNIISYVSAGISFDFYSPNSLLGLMFGVNYSFSDLTISDKADIKYNYFSIKSLEFPAYLRFRLGKKDAKEHLMILMGAVYNSPFSGTRQLMTKSYGNNYQIDSIDNSNSQFQSFLSISTSIGFEFFEGKTNNSRMTAYVNCDYPLGNILNTDYKDFKSTGHSALSNYNNIKISQYRIGFGLRYFFGFRKYKA